MNKRFIQQIVYNEKGMLSLEFAGAFLGFMLIIFLIYDFYSVVAIQGKLDRATYSAATAFRERSNFYPPPSGGNAEQIDAQQVAQLNKLLSGMLKNPSVSVKVDALFIHDNPANPGNIASATLNTVSFCGPSGCHTGFSAQLPFDNFKQLAPYSLAHRWVPLYRVSACIDNRQSLIQKAISSVNQSGIGGEFLCSSSIVVSRCLKNCQTP